MSPENIKKIQTALGISESGIWDSTTIAAFKNYQLRMGPGYPPTGQPDDASVREFIKRFQITLNATSPDNSSNTTIENDVLDLDATTDLTEIPIKEHYLPEGQYCSTPVSKYEYIFLHHTSGWNNPDAVVKDWASDARGQIGTQYIIGGSSIVGNVDHDGKILKCIPDPFWAYHLGSTSKDGISAYMHKNSIGIELCNFGWLTSRNGKFFTYTNSMVDPKYVTTLDVPFRGYKYWHSYSNLQLNSLYHLLKFLGTKYNINLKNGMQQWINSKYDAFEHRPDATAGKIKGVLSHTNVRKDKTDVYPHPDLIKIIQML